MAGCRVKPGMTEEGSAIININPAILPGFLLPKSAFHPFLHLRAARPFQGKTLRMKQVGRNSDAIRENFEKISFINNLAQSISSPRSKNCFLDPHSGHLHCELEISPSHDGCHGQGYAFFDRPRF
ncbi:hypothetical protein AGR13a_Lc60202 [Agrobacterium genomosp. 13 str. CFBP 6927]|uniref:Uncharacterized protein n=2 Tax=Agrobacterium TaxID=357 RepID=A0ABM9VM94_9HYPH|nr:hypothetical protein AGR13a_Lc60202 [Agrobacterium genomosp. 13 str. CFBP 6927]